MIPTLSRFPLFLLDVLLCFQLLMDATLNSANDPYIEITEKFWPPYVDMLLQSDVAEAHPSDVSRIGLIAFHL